MTSVAFARRQPRIIHRYLLGEFVTVFAVSLFSVSLILFMGRSMRVIQMVITKGVAFADIYRFCLYMLPYLLVFTVPMAAMIAVLLTFTRLSGDNEIMALKTSGVSLAQLLPPVLAFGLVIALVSLSLSLYANPWGNREMRQLLLDITKRRADLGIREQVFNTDFQSLMIFVNKIPPGGGHLEGIFVSDERDPAVPHTVVADRGRLLFDPLSQRLVFQLFQGRVLRLNPEFTQLNSVEFETYQIPLELFQFAPARQPSEDEMSWSELRRAALAQPPGSTEYNRLIIELNRRLSLPLGGLLLVLVALPLGVSTRLRGRFLGIILGLVSFLLYYILLTAAWRLGQNAVISPHGAPWLPNAVFVLLAAYLYQRARRDLPLTPFEAGLADFSPALRRFLSRSPRP